MRIRFANYWTLEPVADVLWKGQTNLREKDLRLADLRDTDLNGLGGIRTPDTVVRSHVL